MAEPMKRSHSEATATDAADATESGAEGNGARGSPAEGGDHVAIAAAIGVPENVGGAGGSHGGVVEKPLPSSGSGNSNCGGDGDGSICSGAAATTTATAAAAASSSASKAGRFLRGATKGVPLVAVSASSQGKKKYQEDRVDIRDHAALAPRVRGLGIKNRFGYFAVYDGHGGRRTADFVTAALADSVFAHVAKMPKRGFTKDDVKRALQLGYRDTDEAVQRQAAQQGWGDGCCCVSALVANNLVYIANLGDCSAVLCRRDAPTSATESSSASAVSAAGPQASAAADTETRWGLPPPASAKKLTTDHTLLLASERARVVAAGGRVENGRVNGILEVSRSLGDVKLKRCGVSAEPDTRIHFKITPADEFLLLACDGLWSVLDPTSAVAFVRRRVWAMERHNAFYATREGGQRADSVYPERNYTLGGIAKDLVQFAVHEKGCKDNCTVVLVFFQHARG